MATVSSVASMGYSPASTNSIKKEISDAKSEYSELSKNTNLTTEERQKLQKDYKEKLSSLNDKLSSAEDEALSSIGSTASSMYGANTDTLSLFGNASTGGQTGFDLFFGAKNTLSNLSIVNKARQGIENRARSLTAEIKMDRMRGVNTEGKEEALSNLTSNISLMNDNLSNNVSKALTSEKEDSDYTPVINKIKTQLADNQKILDAKSKTMQAEANKKNGVTETDTTKST